MKKTILIFGSLFGMLAVVFGAFGAHALEKVLNENAIATFETAVKYQMYHALLLLFLGSSNVFSHNTLKLLKSFLILGIVLFSGSIYLLATNTLTSFDFKIIGFITPIGGGLLIVSWALMFYKLITTKRE
ncbi:DUF423 domain-containing protein [Ascidiimonas sp. W6]|uniref:DUF423 domain-containing protein n=1 Tax=Ascidiimonas meishanensis TaxID=3128903 RepID=UPI0030EB6D2F